MTQTPDEFDVNSLEEGSEGWKSLRSAYSKQQARLKELETEKNARERAEQIGSTLQAKGLDPAMAAIIPADADPAKWIDTYGHFLNTGQAQKQEPLTPAAPQEPVVVDNNDPAVNAAIDEEALMAAQMEAAQQSGFATPEMITEREKELQNVKTEADLLALINRDGGFNIG